MRLTVLFLCFSTVSLLLVCVSGCAFFQSNSAPLWAVTSSGEDAAVLSAEDLDGIDLHEVEGVFPEGENVDFQSFEPRFAREKSLLGGRYAFGDNGSVTIRAYHLRQGAIAALNDRLSLGGPYQLGEKTEWFQLDWWYKEGPPATILFCYSNVFACIRMSELSSGDIYSKGLKAAGSLVGCIRRAAEDGSVHEQ